MDEMVKVGDFIVRAFSWEEVYERLKEAPVGYLYGIPRGGAVVAGLTGRAIDDWRVADYIVDDIVDSGKTRQKWSQYGKPFWALVDKQKEGIGCWVRFPWEEENQEADLEDTVIRQLEAIGEHPRREGLRETPKRVIKAFFENVEGYKQDTKEILSKVFIQAYDEMVIVQGIEFFSLCEHHLLPFHGKVSVGYIPDGQVVGLSKISRLVQCFAKRLQIQEKMTQEIARSIHQVLKPKGVAVYVEAIHLCMAMRGIKTSALMKTNCILGVMRTPEARSEFLRIIGK